VVVWGGGGGYLQIDPRTHARTLRSAVVARYKPHGSSTDRPPPLCPNHDRPSVPPLVVVVVVVVVVAVVIVVVAVCRSPVR
jgi:hypothetical protein